MLAASDLSVFILFAFPPRLLPPITSTLNNYSQLRNHTHIAVHILRETLAPQNATVKDYEPASALSANQQHLKVFQCLQ